MELAEKVYLVQDSESALLQKFGLKRNELVEVIKQVLLARSDITVNHPINSKGTYSYHEGTRFTRELLIPKGWKKDRPNSLEAVTNPEETISLVFQNTVDAADPAAIPQPISKKGPGCRKAIQERMLDLFPNEKKAAEECNNTNNMLWFFCVSVKEVNKQVLVSAELFCPRKIEDQHFEGFIERIFILRNENMIDTLNRADSDDFEYTTDEDNLELDISRK